ncbi:unnamed protein product [Phytophthora lilii]|uniref:Unnamed protein product n=1 Tax=Phytophthora lilii TaxID=2077276 RepID=A0A9W6X2K4_9STRA|nr:unnamed protein product [Phytophthora lilii]
MWKNYRQHEIKRLRLLESRLTFHLQQQNHSHGMTRQQDFNTESNHGESIRSLIFPTSNGVVHTSSRLHPSSLQKLPPHGQVSSVRSAAGGLRRRRHRQSCTQLPGQLRRLSSESRGCRRSDLSEFLDHIDIPDLVLELTQIHGSNEPPSSAAESTSNKRHRTTPKQEIAQLRAQERELVCRLENLRLQAYGHKQLGSSVANSIVLPFWKKSHLDSTSVD